VLSGIRKGRARDVAILTLLVLAVILVVGVVTDRDSFVSNLLAELAGVAVGVLVALFLVDRVTAARRRERWLRVRRQTFDAIYAHISDLARKALLYTPVGDYREPGWVDSWFAFGGDHPTGAAAQVLREVGKALHEQAEELSSRDGPGVANSRVALDVVTPHVAQIRDVLIPRLIDFDEVPNLVERLLAMSDAEREWSLQVAFSEKGDLQEVWVGWDKAGDFFEACGDVVEFLMPLNASAAAPGRGPLGPPGDRQKIRSEQKWGATPCAAPPPGAGVSRCGGRAEDSRGPPRG
jgi:hypothetical protein